MTPYEKKLAALGITNRGQLAKGFEDELAPSSKAPKQPMHKGRKPKPVVVAEDLTHLKSEGKGETMRRIWVGKRAAPLGAEGKRGGGVKGIQAMDRHG